MAFCWNVAPVVLRFGGCWQGWDGAPAGSSRPRPGGDQRLYRERRDPRPYGPGYRREGHCRASAAGYPGLYLTIVTVGVMNAPTFRRSMTRSIARFLGRSARA